MRRGFCAYFGGGPEVGVLRDWIGDIAICGYHILDIKCAALRGKSGKTVKIGDPEMATSKRVRTYRPKHSDTSLSREWRTNMANKKIKKQNKFCSTVQ